MAKDEIERRTSDDTLGEFERTDAPPYSRSMSLQKTNELRKCVKAFERGTAGALHDQGSRLIEAFARKVDRALGYASFEDYLSDELGLPQPTAHERMRFAKFVTQEEAEAFGYTRCLLAARLSKLLKLGSLAAVRRASLRDEEGRTFKLAKDTPVRRLQSALRVQAALPLTDDTRTTTINASKRLVDTEVARVPVLRKLNVRFTVRKGLVEVRHAPVRGPDAMRALGELLVKLAAIK